MNLRIKYIIISIAFLILISTLSASDSAFQRTETMYFSDSINVVKISNLCGTIEFSNYEEEVFYQSLIFTDEGKIEESRRLSSLTQIKTYLKADTLFIVANYPVTELKEIKYKGAGNFFSDNIEASYQSQNVIVSPRGGIETYIDFKIGIPHDVTVILETVVSKVFLDHVDFDIKLNSQYTDLKGVISDCNFTCNTARAICEFEGIHGGCNIKSRKSLDFEISQDLAGSLILNCNEGDIDIETDIKSDILRIHEKSGKLTFSGICPDSVFIETSDVAIRLEVKDNPGNCRIITDSGNSQYYFKDNLFGEIDIATKSGNIKCNSDFPIVYSNDDKIATFKSDQAGRLFIRSNDADIDLKIFD